MPALKLVVCTDQRLQAGQARDVLQIVQPVVADVQRVQVRQYLYAAQVVQDVLLNISTQNKTLQLVSMHLELSKATCKTHRHLSSDKGGSPSSDSSALPSKNSALRPV